MTKLEIAVADLLANCPTGGTARERQAWRNGVLECADALGVIDLSDEQSAVLQDEHDDPACGEFLPGKPPYRFANGHDGFDG